MQTPVNLRTVALRVVALALLLLLALVAGLSVRTLNRVPNTLLYFVHSGDTRFSLQSAPRRLPRAARETYLKRTLEILIEGPNADEQAQGLTSSLPTTTQRSKPATEGR